MEKIWGWVRWFCTTFPGSTHEEPLNLWYLIWISHFNTNISSFVLHLHVVFHPFDLYSKYFSLNSHFEAFPFFLTVNLSIENSASERRKKTITGAENTGIWIDNNIILEYERCLRILLCNYISNSKPNHTNILNYDWYLQWEYYYKIQIIPFDCQKLIILDEKWKWQSTAKII